VIKNFEQQAMDTTYIAFLSFKQRIGASERKKLEQWLKARLKTEEIKMIIE
jgi:hypothetical protein